MRYPSLPTQPLVGLLFLLLVGCGPRPSEPPPEAPAVEPTPSAPTTQAPERATTSTRLDRFCDAMLALVDAEAAGFAAVRAAPDGRGAWRGALVPEGLQACSVEGARHPSAEYVCRGQATTGNGTLLATRFNEISADLDACFGRAVWFPRNWQGGEVMEFAGGERQRLWRDLAPLPKPAVSLKIEEDFSNRIYFVRFSVFTLR